MTDTGTQGTGTGTGTQQGDPPPAQQGTDGTQQGTGTSDDGKGTNDRPAWWNPEWNALPEAAQAAIMAASTSAGSEAANYRRRMAAAEAKVKEFEDREKTEAEKAADRIKELEAERETLLRARQEATVGSVVASVAGELAFLDPTDAARYVNVSEFVPDEDGKDVDRKKVRAALEAVVTSKPYLVGRRSANGSAGGGPGAGAGNDGSQDMNALIRRQAGRTG